MTNETTRILAQALVTRHAAERGLRQILIASAEEDLPATTDRTLEVLATSYVHEQRIINRIISEELVDERIGVYAHG